MLFLCEIVGGILMFALMDHVRSTITSHIKQAIVSYQTNERLQDFIDYVQRKVSFIFCFFLFNYIPLSVLFWDVYRLCCMLKLLGVSPLGVYNQNTVGESGTFKPLYVKISLMVSKMATVTINHQ